MFCAGLKVASDMSQEKAGSQKTSLSMLIVALQASNSFAGGEDEVA